jgi:hypothetical protein
MVNVLVNRQRAATKIGRKRNCHARKLSGDDGLKATKTECESHPEGRREMVRKRNGLRSANADQADNAPELAPLDIQNALLVGVLLG